MYHDASDLPGPAQRVGQAPGGGTEIPVTVWTQLGPGCPASVQATMAPQSCPTTCARDRPVCASAASTTAAASATTSAIR